MTIHRRLNMTGFGGNYTTWWLFKTMIDAGWTVKSSGSGSGGLYDESNVFDLAQTPKNYTNLDANNVGIGSEPWGHPACWFVVEDPGGNRQFRIQRRGSAGDLYDAWWITSYSPSGLFGIGQTPGVDWGATTAPNASDVAVIRDGYSFSSGEYAVISHIACDDTPSPAGEYGVLAMQFEATNSMRGAFLIDDLRSAPVGHPHALVTWVPAAGNRLSIGYYHGNVSADSPGTVVDFGGDTQTYLTNSSCCRWYGYSTEGLGNGGVGADGKERAFPIVVGMLGFEGYMGVSRWFRSPSVVHSYPDTATGQTYLFVDDVVVVDLLDGATTPSSI